MSSSRLSATWLGHGTFLLGTPSGRRFLVDPWLDTNPACPEDWQHGGWQQRLGKLDAILVTHGHSDHMPRDARRPAPAGRRGRRHVTELEPGETRELTL